MKTIYLDTEVTGLEKNDKLCQIAFLVVDEKGNFEIYEELCNPQMPISQGASECHGITDEIVSDKNTFVNSSLYQILESLNNEDNCFVAHNAPFDIEMLRRDGFVWEGKVIDTLKVARRLYNKDSAIKSFALQNLRESLSLEKYEHKMIKQCNVTIKAHDALGDVISLFALVNFLMEDFSCSIEKLIELSNDDEYELTFLPFGKYRGKSFDEVAQENPEYLQWICKSSDFDKSIIYSAKLALERLKGD